MGTLTPGNLTRILQVRRWRFGSRRDLELEILLRDLLARTWGNTLNRQETRNVTCSILQTSLLKPQCPCQLSIRNRPQSNVSSKKHPNSHLILIPPFMLLPKNPTSSNGISPLPAHLHPPTPTVSTMVASSSRLPTHCAHLHSASSPRPEGSKSIVKYV